MRASLWRRLLLALLLITLAPVLFVWITPWYEAQTEQNRRARVAEVTLEAMAAAPTREGLGPVAEAHGARIRLLSAEGQLQVDVDRTLDTRWADLLGFIGLSPRQRRRLERYDEALPPLPERAVLRALDAAPSAADCQKTPDRMVLVCQRAARLPGGARLHIQTGSPRSVRGLYEARYQLLKLAGQVVGVALLIGLWLIWRARRPMRRLRDEVLARTAAPVSTQPVSVPPWVEVGELAAAFNVLLAALEQQRRGHVAFVAEVAHDIKNAAATMRACGEALEGGQDPKRLARVRRALQASSARIVDLAEGFVALGRADAGLPDVARARFDLAPRLERLAEAARGRAPEVEIEVEALETFIEGAAEALDRAWANLLDNAADFAARGGGHVWVRLTHAGPRALLEIRDDGPGIDPEDAPRVFERYFSRRAGGAGLGLPIARALIEAHGGRVEALPIEGGALIQVKLPRA